MRLFVNPFYILADQYQRDWDSGRIIDLPVFILRPNDGTGSCFFNHNFGYGFIGDLPGVYPILSVEFSFNFEFGKRYG